MLAVVQSAPIGLRLTERGSAYLRFVEFRGSLDVVHFRYGSSVHFPQLPTPPHGDAVEVVFRREQPNSTDGTFPTPLAARWHVRDLAQLDLLLQVRAVLRKYERWSV